MVVLLSCQDLVLSLQPDFDQGVAFLLSILNAFVGVQADFS